MKRDRIMNLFWQNVGEAGPGCFKIIFFSGTNWEKSWKSWEYTDDIRTCDPPQARGENLIATFDGML
jgi:hypothetical protein